ncbi:hypothetical protein EJB05_13669 [Eragrostis curvula]|uniref:5'-3' exoribonuclease n=1 Tax=Eragrostis curvula TaxID=38414 RepID=A0A5J9VX69_9POAL|nr:hypothetical protein EJB05_13669 [Eragrostis curvula]
MGIHGFFKWVVTKYPGVISPAKEEPAAGHGSSKGTSDGIVYDNLYLDMNFIIHSCFHPQDSVHTPTHVRAPTTLDEVFESIFTYMDCLVRVVRPRRLLYLAVDGVAPCAKMNQIRRGRFHTARMQAATEEEENRSAEESRAQGKEVPPRETSPEVSDPNVITPGTEFMEKLSQALEYYVRSRLNSDPDWKHMMVILSDANVPGEGEHKIMSFIRAQRSVEGYDPNTRHCLFGHDADLIVLALASHEVHFSILREDALLPYKSEKNSGLTEASLKKAYLFLNIWVLREYLEIELKILDPVCEPDIERLIDDFIFICFLLGNDFIPKIPSLEVHEYAVDLLIEVYKTTFNKMGGYIVSTDKIKDKHAAYLDVSRLEIFFHELSVYEEKIFLKRYGLQQESLKQRYHEILDEASETERLRLRPKLDDLLFNEDRPYDRVSDAPFAKYFLFSRQIDKYCSCSPAAVLTHLLQIRRGLPGWKSRFYREYFGVETSNEIGKLKNDLAQKYLEGLCWVLQCYFADVPSWSWYYPFYVAPFVSDLKGLSQFEIHFTMDKPLRPFDQLMAVLPAQSGRALPKCYRKLMAREEPKTQPFCPNLQTDMNGKHFFWNVISEELLLSATKEADRELSVHEMRRNTTRQEKIFLKRDSNALGHNEVFVPTPYSPPQKAPIDSAMSGIGGWLSPHGGNDDGLISGFFGSPVKDLQDSTNDQAVSATFFNPEAMNPIPGLLENARVPEKTVTGADISKRPLWHTYPGLRPPRPK